MWRYGDVNDDAVWFPPGYRRRRRLSRRQPVWNDLPSSSLPSEPRPIRPYQEHDIGFAHQQAERDMHAGQNRAEAEMIAARQLAAQRIAQAKAQEEYHRILEQQPSSAPPPAAPQRPVANVRNLQELEALRLQRSNPVDLPVVERNEEAGLQQASWWQRRILPEFLGGIPRDSELEVECRCIPHVDGVAYPQLKNVCGGSRRAIPWQNIQRENPGVHWLELPNGQNALEFQGERPPLPVLEVYNMFQQGLQTQPVWLSMDKYSSPREDDLRIIDDANRQSGQQFILSYAKDSKGRTVAKLEIESARIPLKQIIGKALGTQRLRFDARKYEHPMFDETSWKKFQQAAAKKQKEIGSRTPIVMRYYPTRDGHGEYVFQRQDPHEKLGEWLGEFDDLDGAYSKSEFLHPYSWSRWGQFMRAAQENGQHINLTDTASHYILEVSSRGARKVIPLNEINDQPVSFSKDDYLPPEYNPEYEDWLKLQADLEKSGEEFMTSQETETDYVFDIGHEQWLRDYEPYEAICCGATGGTYCAKTRDGSFRAEPIPRLSKRQEKRRRSIRPRPCHTSF